MAEQRQHLIYLVKPKRWLTLFKITNKSQAYTGPFSQINLGHTQLFAAAFNKKNEIFSQNYTFKGIE